MSIMACRLSDFARRGLGDFRGAHVFTSSTGVDNEEKRKPKETETNKAPILEDGGGWALDYARKISQVFDLGISRLPSDRTPA